MAWLLENDEIKNTFENISFEFNKHGKIIFDWPFCFTSYINVTVKESHNRYVILKINCIKNKKLNHTIEISHPNLFLYESDREKKVKYKNILIDDVNVENGSENSNSESESFDIDFQTHYYTYLPNVKKLYVENKKEKSYLFIENYKKRFSSIDATLDDSGGLESKKGIDPIISQEIECDLEISDELKEFLKSINYLKQLNKNITVNYKEKEQIRKTADKGKIDFPASLKRNVKFFQEDGSPFFDKYTVRGSKPNEKNLITQIHKYCVFEAFSTLGWLFTPHFPSDPHITLESERFLYTIKQKLKDTYNDKDKLLFQAMVQMLEYLDTENQEKQYYFGTDRFEYVWEKLIDEIFGIRGKEEFFPRTKWKMKFKGEKDNHALEPDSIMLCNNKIYVLDAKYYRYGVTGKMNHLPESSSINKQITYGEYIDNCKSLKDKYGELPIYNAFLMPFNKSDNPFNVTDNYFINVGEAISEWKHNDKSYEKVQGVVVDIRFIMNNYNGSHKSKILKLAKVIDEELEKNNRELSVSS